MAKPSLTLNALRDGAADFAEQESKHGEPSLFGVTDGKAVGTYLEHKFLAYLESVYQFTAGSSAKGIDLPSLDVDIKTTSIKQPQSSCPFKSARQKIYGLGYSLLVFVYDKTDDQKAKTANLDLQHVIFVERDQTADYQMTRGLREIIDRDGNEDDLVAFMQDKMLPVDDVEASQIARDLLKSKPNQGYLTISNAFQWRLQYKRVIDSAGTVSGIVRVR